MNRIHLSLALVGVCGIAQAGTLEPPAGPPAPTMKTLSEVEARIPIRQSDIPLSITLDGSYYLVEHLYATQNGQDMITVWANHVSIDLNGFTVHGTSQVAIATDGIQIEQDVRTFTLTNGTIRGCGQNGVVTNNPFGLSVNVDRVHAIQNGSAGLMFSSTGIYGVISRSVARANGVHGIYLREGVLQNCAAFNNGSVGLQIVYGTFSSCVARGNPLNAVISLGGTSVGTYAP